MVLLGTFAAFLSEFLTAGLLVICTCMARSSQVNSTELGVAGMSAGLIHLLLAKCFGQISGAHGNPAVSLALYLRGSMKLRRFIIFAVGQIIGAAVGHYTVNSLLGKSPTDPMCIFQPKDDVEDLKIFGMSFLMTFILIMAWCSLWDYENLPIEAYLVVVNTMISLMGINENGYIVIEDFLTAEEVDELYGAGRTLCMEAPQANRKVFSTTKCEDTHSKETYFLESGDKVRFFFEEGALDNKGDLIVDPTVALNKVGHALHVENPIFQKYTFSNKIRELCWQLNFNRPAVCQSMYIYKNPGIGGEVIPHQDSWFLCTEPNSVIGFWIALENCTQQNGCLQFVKGSHKSGRHRRYYRNPDKTAKELMIYDRPAPIYPQSNFTPITCKKGTLIIIHGDVVHKSEPNRSQKSRHVYTFHVIETENNVKYAEDNWLQPPKDNPFPILFERKN